MSIHLGSGRKHFVVTRDYSKRYYIGHDQIKLLQSTPSLNVVIHQPPDSKILAIPIVGNFQLASSVKEAPRHQQPLLRTEILASTVSCIAITPPKYKLSQNYSIHRCLNTSTGYGYYSVTASPWNPRVVLRGRLSGIIVQEFTVIHFENRTGLLLTFHVPLGYEYFAFSSTDYEDIGKGKSSYQGGISSAIFEDSFVLPGSNDSILRDIPCNFSYGGNDLVSHGYWILPVANLPRNKWLFDANGHHAASLRESVYRPSNCSIPHLTDEQVSVNVKVCLIGDSQMRHMSTALARLLSRFDPMDSTSSKTDKLLTLHPRIFYRVDKFGETILGSAEKPINRHELTSFLETCDVTVANFGQWSLSWYVSPFPWDVEEYVRQVESYLTVLKKLTSGKLLWLTVNPTAYNPGILYTSDWRTPYLLKRYAQASIDVSRKVGVRYLDLNTVAGSLSDLSYDGWHYMRPVQKQLALLTYHVILDIFSSQRL